MNDDRSEADRILSEDWMMPGYRRYVEAWGKHPQRELLAERRGEVGQTEGRGGAPSASSTRTRRGPRRSGRRRPATASPRPCTAPGT